eukprot:TRINITY_DN6529_c0_g1_i1.p1 TRINITY_DN6529_c0_g1~~TRINITY_DN6529_c0_g1_i1.p1  ORF type:complete len:303 (-),score=12.57 TRINITY_DN6529_c0_g1_i1:81-989(-)
MGRYVELPDETVGVIMLQVDWSDLPGLMRVSKQFNRVLCNNDDIWKRGLWTGPFSVGYSYAKPHNLQWRGIFLQKYKQHMDAVKLKDHQYNVRLCSRSASLKDVLLSIFCPCYVVSDNMMQLLAPHASPTAPSCADMLCTWPNLQPFVGYRVRRQIMQDEPAWYSWWCSVATCMFCFPCGILRDRREIALRLRTHKPFESEGSTQPRTNFSVSLCGLSALGACFCMPCCTACNIDQEFTTGMVMCTCCVDTVYWSRRRIRYKYNLLETDQRVADALLSVLCMPCVVGQGCAEIFSRVNRGRS